MTFNAAGDQESGSKMCILYGNAANMWRFVTFILTVEPFPSQEFPSGGFIANTLKGSEMFLLISLIGVSI